MYLAKEDHAGCELYVAERDEYSPGQARARRRAPPRHRAGRAVPALPAEGRPRPGPDHRRRGARPLAAPRARHARARRVRAARRAHRPDARADALRARGGARPAAPVARRRGSSSIWPSTCPRATCSTSRCRGRSPSCSLPTTFRPSRLELEVTESVILADPLRARRILLALGEIGVRIVIDDYGSGYSSLSYLKHLPVNGIKIDRSFVMNMEQRRERRGDRALDDRARPQPRPDGRRGGRRDGGQLGRAEAARLRARPGLLSQPAGAGRADRPAAARAQRARRQRRRRSDYT